jgi:glutamate racemase
MDKRQRAIGVFDSGLGGLTVLKALMQNLPSEDLVYFGDTARVPYGTKSRESIIRFSKENVSLLLDHHVKMIVVACNSSASHALAILRQKFNVPIVGVIEPGVRKAVQSTRNKVIGVIATPATIASNAYPRLISEQVKKIKVVSQPCPLFVPLVEEGWLDKKVTFAIAEEYLAPVKRAKADTLILGCTHYPLLKPVLRKVMGPTVTLIDSAQEVAFVVKAFLEENGWIRKNHRQPRYKFLVSDQPDHFKRQAKKFLDYPIGRVERVVL